MNIQRTLSLAAAALCASSFSLGSAAGEAMAHAAKPRPPGPALMVMSDQAGGLMASGSTSTFRVLNPSSTVALGALSAKAQPASGFKVESNTCKNGLAPRATCLVTVSWSGQGSQTAASELVVASGAPSIEVRSALRGDAALSR